MMHIALLELSNKTVAADETSPAGSALSSRPSGPSDAGHGRQTRPATRLRGWLHLIPALALTLFLGLPAAKAQDPGFSQFFASPLTLNPALTGKFNGIVRVAGNYRNQWPSINNAFITSTISVDAPIMTNRLPENDT